MGRRNPPNLCIGLEHGSHIFIRNAVKKSGIVRFYAGDKRVGLFEIVLPVVAAGRVNPLAGFFRNVTEHAAYRFFVIIR